jgi:hypothetical protein
VVLGLSGLRRHAADAKARRCCLADTTPYVTLTQ